MWRVPPSWSDETKVAEIWRSSAPFPHLVVDAFVDPARLPALLSIVDEEALHRYDGEIFGFEATAPVATTAAFQALRDSFADVLGPPLRRITGRAVSRVDMRAYLYQAGDYLLPHSDHQDGVGRVLAYAFYLPSADPPEGGELELFRCTFEGGAITATESAKLVAPKANRIVIFEVGDASLHQVREVMKGARISLSGWFYP